MILLDTMMPVMDGCATLRALLSEPVTSLIPVIFLTARGNPPEVARLKGLGAAGVLIKPFNPRTLADDVRAILALTVAARPA